MSADGWDLEEIRRRADLVEIISPHVRLRKAGRRLVGLCPFHQEKTPSFTVDPEKGLWHCFGCKAGGDLFRFMEMIEKVSFSEAVELLARRLGLPPRQRASPARQRERERMLSLHEEAARLFQAALHRQSGAAARAYLQRRGIAKESINEFELGYAPDQWEALLRALGKKGFSGPELAAAGLAVPREDRFYDRFRNRLMFPIRDATGRVIAFGGRALADDQQPKYLNSPETPIFQKGRTLWAFDRARRPMAEAGGAIVVEGYLDAIACHEAGLPETVATMGTALTAQHVELLRRQVNRLVLAFDSDSAGLAAALRGRELFQQAGLEVRVASVPEGTDPDDVIRQRGAEAFRELVENAPPMVEWELIRILSSAEGEGERARLEAFRQAISALARVPAGPDREYYVRWLAERYGPDSPDRRMPLEAELRQALAAEIKRSSGRPRRMPAPAAAEGAAPGQGPERPTAGRLQASLLAALLEREDLVDRYLASLEVEDFPSEGHRAIFEVLRRLTARKDSLSAQGVLAELAPEARPALAELALEYVPGERIEESVASGVRRLVEARLRREETRLSSRLHEAGSTKEREAIQQQLTEIARRRSELAGRRIVGGEQGLS
ncbi:MAG: DNA primase [Armatimonadota bacterium]|nr:MAG: DNA primase [Armatimonadota bacterium]